MKHNKKRNTAFIYETLTRELTKTIVGKDPSRKARLVGILREFFSKGAILRQELELYATLLETTNIQQKIAERLLEETKRAYQRLDENAIFDAQSRIITAINKGLGQEVWSNFVPNFKALASVSSIFNPKTAIKKKVLFEQVIIENMSVKRSWAPPADLKPLDNLAYNSFIKKFNNKYGELLQEQKDFLSRYVTSFADDGFELRLYLNEEISRLKTQLTEITTEDVEAAVAQKASEVVEYLDGFRHREFTDEDLKKVLKTQELVQEIHSHDSN